MAGRIASPVFIGRTAELDDITRHLAEAVEGRASALVIGGEAGVGKTRLVDEAAAIAARDGMAILRGSCLELGDDGLPYGPFIEALRELWRDGDRGELTTLLGPAQAELGALVPEIAGPGGSIPAISETSTSRLYELTLGFLDRLAGARPVLLIIEDLHWSDAGSRDLIRFLARSLRRQRLAIILTFRSDALHRRHPFSSLLAELERTERVGRVELRRLSKAEVRDVVVGIRGVPPTSDALDGLMARTGGNAFFVEELVAAGPDASLDTALTLRDILVDRLDALEPPARRVVDAAAVIGPRFEEELVAVVAGHERSQLVQELRRLVDDHVIEPIDAAPPSYRFRHALVAEAVDAELLPGERVRLHAACAAALEASATFTEPTRSTRMARHWFAAHDLPRALGASVHAGRAAVAARAFAEAQALFERAIEIWARVPDADERAGCSETDAILLAADAAWLAGEPRRAITLIERVVRARQPGDELALAAAYERLGQYRWDAADARGANEAYARASQLIANRPPSAIGARIVATEAQSAMLAGHFGDSERRAREAIDMADAVDAPEVAGHARCTLGVDVAFLGQIDEGLAELREARRVGEEMVRPDDIARAYVNEGLVLWQAGRLEDCLTVSLDGSDAARQLGLSRTLGRALTANAAVALLYLGRWDEAEAMVADALREGVDGLSAVHLRLVQAQLAVLRGDSRTAETTLAEIDRQAESEGNIRLAGDRLAVGAELAVWAGDADRASEVIDRAGLEGERSEDPALVARLCAIGIRAAADQVGIARARRSSEAAEQARGRAERWLGIVRAPAAQGAGPPAPPIATGYRLQAEAEMGRLDGAARTVGWDEVAARWDELQIPFEAAVARWRSAEDALARGAPRADVGPRLRAARAIAETLGAAPLLTEIDGLVRRARIDLGPDEVAATREVRESTGAASLGLSERELEVLELLAAGRTNRQIAETLFITEKTAGTHVSHILAKLDVSNRVEAAAIGVRLGLASAAGPDDGAAGPNPVRRTFLFSDIVGSTQLLEAIGDRAWTSLRAWHDTTLRGLFSVHGGREIDHAGDGFFVAFEASKAALECAISIQRSLAEHRRATGFAPSVRIGVHAGSAIPSGGTYAGRDVNVSARLLGHASAGQIVATVTTLAEAGLAGRDRPEVVELRGIDGPVEIASVRWR
jgi:class 3 adenylate cyclase/tetratricopeptide (TPR) repeat protein